MALVRPRPRLLIAAAAALAFLQACSTPATGNADWPADLPPRESYVQSYESDPLDQALQTLETYLIWVRRFYDGYAIAPGWRAATRHALDGLEGETRDRVAARAADLGHYLSIEWAKDNRRRRISTGMLSTWGSIMRRSRLDCRAETIERVFADARALIAGTLRGEEITSGRYADLTAPTAGGR